MATRQTASPSCDTPLKVQESADGRPYPSYYMGESITRKTNPSGVRTGIRTHRTSARAWVHLLC